MKMQETYCSIESARYLNFMNRHKMHRGDSGSHEDHIWSEFYKKFFFHPVQNKLECFFVQVFLG